VINRLFFMKEIKLAFSRALSNQVGILFKDPFVVFILVIISLALALAAGWVADGFTALIFDKQYKQAAIMLGTSFSIFAIIFGLAYTVVSGLSWEVYQRTPEKKKGLIIILSANKATKEEINNILSKINKKNTIEEKISFVGENTIIRNWEMPLRAINYHADKLKKIVFLTSEKSSKQLELFKKLAREVFRENKTICQALNSVIEVNVNSFEDAIELSEKINEAFNILERNNIENKDSIIDITGGQKPPSVIAALATIFDNREFQYVSTNNPKNIISYDIRLKKA